MKYFTGELCGRINSESITEREQARLEWKQNDEVYSKVFENVKPMLTKKFLKMYLIAHGFHDCEFLSFEVIQPKRWANDPITVRIVISNRESKFTHTYKKVKKIRMNYDSEERMSKWGIDTWRYDEFLLVDDKQLTHEILFASGATIFIQFENKKLFIDRDFMGKPIGKDIK